MVPGGRRLMDESQKGWIEIVGCGEQCSSPQKAGIKNQISRFLSEASSGKMKSTHEEDIHEKSHCCCVA
jgi:hypothetical protein